MGTRHLRSIASRRRDFLLQGLAVTGGAVVATIAGRAAADLGPEPIIHDEPGPKSAGYQETPHIREYYAKAGH
jgi:hypothetical protein